MATATKARPKFLEILDVEINTYRMAGRICRLVSSELGVRLMWMPCTGPGERSFFTCEDKLTKQRAIEIEYFVRGAINAFKSS